MAATSPWPTRSRISSGPVPIVW